MNFVFVEKEKKKQNENPACWMFFSLICFLTNHMKVPWEEVPELVAGRRVFLHKGYAYIAIYQVNIMLTYMYICFHFINEIFCF